MEAVNVDPTMAKSLSRPSILSIAGMTDEIRDTSFREKLAVASAKGWERAIGETTKRGKVVNKSERCEKERCKSRRVRRERPESR